MSGRTVTFFFAAATLLVVGLSTGSAIYYMLFAAMLSMLLLGAAATLLALFTARVAVEGARKRVARGETVTLTIAVRHKSPLPVRCLYLTLSMPDAADSDEVELHAPPFLERLYEYEFTCPHRGQYRVGATELAVVDMFALFTFKRRLRGAAWTVEVAPRVYELPALELRSGDSGPEFFTRMTEDVASPADTRAWREGDALKKVHWKLSMRKRELYVRTYEESARPDTLILIDLAAIGALKSQTLALEDAICEAAASIATAQLAASYPVRMPLVNVRPIEVSGQGPLDAPRFIEALSRVMFDCPYSYEQVLTLEMRRMQRTGGVVLVTARLNARIADVAIQMRRAGIHSCVCCVSESSRLETRELLARLALGGVRTLRASPWNEGLFTREDVPSP